MRRRGRRALALSLVLLAGPFTAQAAAQSAPDGEPPVPFTVRDAPPDEPVYAPLPWELDGVEIPLLAPEVIDVARQDAATATFQSPDALGGFRSAPLGGGPRSSPGVPLFGLAAPPHTAGGLLPTTSGRFTTSTIIDRATAIPQVEAGDGRRVFTFVDGIPDLPPDATGSAPWPAPGSAAGPIVIPDPRPAPPPDEPAPTPTPNVLTSTPFPTIVTSPTPAVPPPAVSPAPSPTPTPTSTPTAITTPLTTPPTTTSPPATTPPVGTTSTTIPPVTTSAPTTSTTRPPSTTTVPSRPTTTTPTTQPTTQPTPPPTTVVPDPPPPTVSFVLSSRREEGTACLSSDGGGTTSCPSLLDVSNARPGQPYPVKVTLWNVGDTAATRLEVLAPGGCTSAAVGPGPHGTGNLCDGVEVKVERFDDVERTQNGHCIFGCGARRTLADFAADHASAGNGALIASRFTTDEKAYLLVTLTLPSRGFETDGTGRDNEYLGRRAAMAFSWRMSA